MPGYQGVAFDAKLSLLKREPRSAGELLGVGCGDGTAVGVGVGSSGLRGRGLQLHGENALPSRLQSVSQLYSMLSRLHSTVRIPIE